MAAKKKQRRKGEPISLPEEEWDFQKCPPDEIWDCWLFEYSREFVRQGNALPSGLLDFITPDEVFPRKPYLSIPIESRLHKKKVNTLPATEEETKLIEGEAKLARSLGVWGDYNPIHATKDDPDLDDIWTLHIDWTLPPKKLAKDFRRWILVARPNDRAPDENRGKDPRGKRKSELNKLGAYRLLKTGISPYKAMLYTVAFKGFIPYNDQSDWYKAKKDAAQILSDWPPDYLR